MRVVVQRVSQSSVIIESDIVSSISKGLLILLGVENNDTLDDVNWLIRKIINLRIFTDIDGKMNNSILDIKGDVKVVHEMVRLLKQYVKPHRMRKIYVSGFNRCFVDLLKPYNLPINFGFTTENNFTVNQLKSWGVKFHTVRTGTKIGADIFVDDKGIQDKRFFQD